MTPKLGSSLQPNTESPRGKGEKKKRVKQTLLADPSQFGSKWENMSLLLIWNDDIVTTLLSGCSYLWHCRVAIVLANGIFFFGQEYPRPSTRMNISSVVLVGMNLYLCCILSCARHSCCSSATLPQPPYQQSEKAGET